MKAKSALVSLAAAGLLAAGCHSSPAGGSRPAAPNATAWVDQPVTFLADGITIYGTYRHARVPARAVPAALLIAGSGPTDRNGNSPLLPGTVDTLQTVAEWLSADGVASLRYDKLGSGQTGVGPYGAHPGAIGIAPFEREAAAGVSFLARQPDADRSRIAVIGHSEGALFALLLATGVAGSTQPVAGIGLLEPLSIRYLDVLTIQLRAQVAAARRAGLLAAGRGADVERSLTAAVKSLRTTGRVPGNLPPGLAAVLSPQTALFLSQADRYDPAQLAARLRAHVPVLVTCSDADRQVTCTEVKHLLAGLARAKASTDFVQLRGADHVLKQDPSGSATGYTAPLPFSSQLRTAMRAFVEANLTSR